MKSLFIKNICLTSIFFYFTLQAIENSLLAVVLMVKNEESVIINTLRSYSDQGLTHFLVFDTGSEDKTVQLVKNFFETNKNIIGVLLQEPFIDFSTSRNHALDEAEKIFPDAQFLLMPDAEWYLHNGQELIDFCKDQYNLDSEAYLVRLIGERLDFYTPRLIRRKSGVRFCGPVHEATDRVISLKVPQDIFFKLKVGKSGIQKSAQRWHRDLEILLKEYEKKPHDPRTLFYIGQTYECLGELKKAFDFYEKRRTQSGSYEESFETLYRLGRVTNILAATDTSFTWEQAFNYYIQAYTLMPHRAEPLVAIADHYWPSCIPLCFLFARRAVELPYPTNDTLFIDKALYEYDRYELLSRCAWHVGEYEIGEYATRMALGVRETSHLYHNLAYYLGSIDQQKSNKNTIN
ncbi:MAG: glycosyltransferase [Candidatus Babeliaceae bacterium]